MNGCMARQKRRQEDVCKGGTYDISYTYDTLRFIYHVINYTITQKIYKNMELNIKLKRRKFLRLSSIFAFLSVLLGLSPLFICMIKTVIFF